MAAIVDSSEDKGSAALSRRTLPIIDFAGVRARDPAAQRTAARQIHDACTDFGFFYLANHGVPQPVIDDAVAVARRFFACPVEQKREVAINKNHRGFSEIGGALMYGARKPDRKEFYTIGLELPADDPSVLAGEPLRGPNNWPRFLPALRPAYYRYYEEIGQCGAALLRAVALSLEVDEGFFEKHYRKRLQRTQMIHYPPQPPDLGADEFGVAPHTDYGCITLLWQDDKGGLQVRDRKTRAWIDATPISGTLVINVGDLLGRWSNDRFASTPHRVINRSGEERYSIASFYDPDFAAIVDPRQLGASAAACRYQPVAAGEHILKRIADSFEYRRKLATAAVGTE
jgi:isopenicillin N synthase-like dioxygenase